ncbi:MAG TPA: hypothetical protein DEA28_04015 [Firmicutes bacterium]|nr:hypothetical protein [Bacillota bacterium]
MIGKKLLSGLFLFTALGLVSCSETIDIGKYFDYKETNKEATLTLKGVSSLYVNEQSRVYVEVSNSSLTKVNFTSSDENILTIDQTGLMKALKVGKVTIEASLSKNLVKTLNVEVKEKSIDSYDVRFVDYDGTLLYETFVKPNESATYVGNEPKRSSNFERAFIFKGWDKDFSHVTSDLLVKATYTEVNNTEFVFTPVSAGGEEGYMLYYYLGNDKKIVIPDSYQNKPVTRIDTAAFSYAKNLEEITFPDSINELGDSLFYGNTTIKEVNIPDSVYEIGSGMFEDCVSLNKVTLPEGMTILPEDTFYGCTSLKEIILPSTVSKIADNAFKDCSSLQTLNFKKEDMLVEIGESAFENTGFTSFTLPKNVTILGESAFSDCTKLTSFVWNDKLNSTSRYLFDGCSNLSSFTFKDVLNTIEYRTFLNNGFETFTLPDTVTSVKEKAFSGNEKLTTFVWNKNVTEIPSGCFDSCSELTSFSGNDNVTSIGSSSFYGTAFSKINGTNLLKSKVTTIGSNAFFGGTKLLEVTIPKNVTTIESQAFRNNKLLTKVTIEEGVTTIGANAFAACPNLTSITFPNSLVSYGTTSTGMFTDSFSVESINLGNNVKNYKSVDGVVYTKDESTLFEYPLGNKSTSYKIIDGATKIGNGAFAGAKYLKSIDFNKVTTIGSDILASSYGDGSSIIENITTPETLTSLSSSFGYSKYLETLDLSLSIKLKAVPNSLARNCLKLVEVKLPTTIEKINSNAFGNCSNLTSINLPSKIRSIGSNAFKGANKLIATFDGTIADFYGLGDDAIGSNAFASGAIVRCKDGDIKY